MRSFHPFASRDIAASPPHAKGSAYRVAIGVEYWPDGPKQVEKVQMVHDGKVSGRRSPSFPIGTDDFDRVAAALRALRAVQRTGADPKPEFKRLTDLIGTAKGIYGTPEELQKERDELRKVWP